MLAAKMHVLGAVGAQIRPEFGFGGGVIVAEFSRTVHDFRRGAFSFLYRVLLPAPSRLPAPLGPPIFEVQNGGMKWGEMGEERLLMEREAG